MEASPAISAETQVATEPRDMPQASRQGQPLQFSKHAAPGAPRRGPAAPLKQ